MELGLGMGTPKVNGVHPQQLPRHTECKHAVRGDTVAPTNLNGPSMATHAKAKHQTHVLRADGQFEIIAFSHLGPGKQILVYTKLNLILAISGTSKPDQIMPSRS